MAGTIRTPDAGMIERVIKHVTSDGKTQSISTPFTGELLVELPVSTAEDVRVAYAKARAAQAAWARLPARERIKPFLALHDAIIDRRDEILDIVQLETGKARRHAFEEVLDVAACTLYYV